MSRNHTQHVFSPPREVGGGGKWGEWRLRNDTTPDKVTPRRDGRGAQGARCPRLPPHRPGAPRRTSAGRGLCGRPPFSPTPAPPNPRTSGPDAPAGLLTGRSADQQDGPQQPGHPPGPQPRGRHPRTVSPEAGARSEETREGGEAGAGAGRPGGSPSPPDWPAGSQRRLEGRSAGGRAGPQSAHAAAGIPVSVLALAAGGVPSPGTGCLGPPSGRHVRGGRRRGTRSEPPRLFPSEFYDVEEAAGSGRRHSRGAAGWGAEGRD